ncbi:MBL fold metallo-hydrolase RNA specificity domain-containing protein [Leptothrix discophora]|uniref:MBL fold metallo-hydrolase n=1 Tax=Leptothrix discophora TaxID=89 RepID=A0ABT9G268_LEPDI|nr:MBL fold metallo-hydrolase [Leptothrix discophora]MDP4300583.1 MBL fold metallo-hydrolase [Leptothrix discophora]
MLVQILGAADCVTGSRHFVRGADGATVLLDCGLFQGWKPLRERNWLPLGIAPHSLDAVILSHAHLDHSGWLPALVREGYRGRIWCSPATRDLAEVLLLDSAHLQEEDARRANRGGWTRHLPARPLYTRRDAIRAIELMRPITPLKAFSPAAGLTARLTPAGHLLGACSVTLRDRLHTLVYSGDIGRSDDLLMRPPQTVADAPDLLLVESTYGDRLHDAPDEPARLGEIVRRTIDRGGSVLMPTFAVGRAQMLMLVLQRLKRSGELPAGLPIYLDSPMAQAATRIHLAHPRLMRLSQAELRTLCDGVTAVEDAADSRRLARRKGAAVILSSSGMATGGRVLTYLAAMAPEPRHSIVFPGYQVAGSRGGRLVDGAREIKVMGQIVPVRAEVHHLRGLSGHADANGLVAWMRQLPAPPRQVLVVHGEPSSSDALRLRIERELGWPARVPRPGESVALAVADTTGD